MVIGGIAAIARGVRRMTTDIDVVVRGDATSLEKLLSKLAASKIVPRIPDARAFAKTNLVLLVRHAPSGVDLDISLGWTKFEQEAIEASSEAVFGTVAAPMALPQDLVVLKAVAARPKDVEDATSLLVMYPNIDVIAVRATVSELAALAEDPALLAGLDAIVALARPKKPAPKIRPAAVAPKKRPTKRGSKRRA
jgi:hypothetical protein